MISKRIDAIAKYTKDSYKITDVGCDHGYLIIEALKNYGVTYAVAIDNKPRPLEFAINNVEKEGLKDKVKFSLSSGLEDLDLDSDTIIISGLGGILISHIIDDNIKKINNQKLILQANRNNYDLRKYLNNNGFTFLEEEIIFDSFYYQIMVVRKDKQNKLLTESDLLYGPINIQEKSKLFIELLKKDEKRLNKIPDSNVNKKKKLDIIRSILYEN